MLYVTNQDKPGFVGRFATCSAEAGINIATFHLGRESAGGNAIALVEVDGTVPPEVLAKVQQHYQRAAGQAAAVLSVGQHLPPAAIRDCNRIQGNSVSFQC